MRDCAFEEGLNLRFADLSGSARRSFALFLRHRKDGHGLLAAHAPGHVKRTFPRAGFEVEKGRAAGTQALPYLGTAEDLEVRAPRRELFGAATTYGSFSALTAPAVPAARGGVNLFARQSASCTMTPT